MTDWDQINVTVAADAGQPPVSPEPSPATEAPAAESTPPQDGPARGPDGKFVPKAESTPPAAAPGDQADAGDGEPPADGAGADKPGDEPETPETKAEKRRRNDPDRRIGQAVAKQRQAERERDQERETRMALERRLDALERRLSGQPPADAEPSQPAGATPKPSALKPEDFETYDDYTAAVAEQRAASKVEEIFAARARLEREAAHRRATETLLAQHHQRFEQARTAHPEFEELAEADLEITPPMGDAIIASDVGPEMAYHLLTHEDERARIAALPPGPALFEMGRLAERVRAAQAPASSPAASGSAPATPAPKPLTKAPPPIQPVGQSPNANGPDESRMSLSEYVRTMNERERQRRAG